MTGKKVSVLTARGGTYSESSPSEPKDHQAPYLRTVLGFLGLDDVTFIHAHGVAGGEDGIRAAEVEVDRAVATATALRRLAA